MKAAKLVTELMEIIINTLNDGSVNIYQDFYKSHNKIHVAFRGLGKSDTLWMDFYYEEMNEEITVCNIVLFDDRAKGEVAEFTIKIDQALKILKHRAEYNDFYEMFNKMQNRG